MAKRQSALAANYHRGLHGRPGEPGVRLQEVPDLNLYQMSAWPETLGTVGTTVAQAIGSSKTWYWRPGNTFRGAGCGSWLNEILAPTLSTLSDRLTRGVAQALTTERGRTDES